MYPCDDANEWDVKLPEEDGPTYEDDDAPIPLSELVEPELAQDDAA
jgi:hypothetical protein